MIKKICIISTVCLMTVSLQGMQPAHKVKTAPVQAGTLKLRQGVLFQIMERIDKDESLQDMAEDDAADMLIQESAALRCKGLYSVGAKIQFFTGSFLWGAVTMLACLTYLK